GFAATAHGLLRVLRTFADPAQRRERRMSTNRTAPAAATAASSPWSPFRHRSFVVLWTATVVSNVGSWMYNAASGWLMTSLNPDPLIVSMVQVATSLPMFLFALPAGALADIIDRRKFLLFSGTGVTA